MISLASEGRPRTEAGPPLSRDSMMGTQKGMQIRSLRCSWRNPPLQSSLSGPTD